MSHKSATSNAMLGLYFICLEYTLNKYIYKYIYIYICLVYTAMHIGIISKKEYYTCVVFMMVYMYRCKYENKDK